MNLPPKVHPKGPSLYYVDKNKWHRLCAIDAPEHELYAELTRLLKKGAQTLSQVMDDYMTIAVPKLATSTQKEYERVVDKRLRPWIGHMHPEDLSSQDIAAYLEERERGGHGPGGNREIAVLSSIYAHGMRMRACRFNPCYGVRRNRESPRTYYVSDESLRHALRTATTGLRYLMWAAYLTGFRQRDLRLLRKENVTPDGLKVVQSKDGKFEMRLWSDSLRKLVRRSLERSECDYVFTNERGQKWTTEAITSAMGRLKSRAGIDWNFHDLRAKAESDHDTGLGLMRRYSRATRRAAVR